MSACAGTTRRGSRSPHVRHDRADGQPADAPHRSADLVRLVSFAFTAAVLPGRCGQTRLKFGENTESKAAPTLIWSRSKSAPCADVAASWVFLRAPNRRVLQAALRERFRFTRSPNLFVTVASGQHLRRAFTRAGARDVRRRSGGPRSKPRSRTPRRPNRPRSRPSSGVRLSPTQGPERQSRHPSGRARRVWRGGSGRAVLRRPRARPSAGSPARRPPGDRSPPPPSASTGTPFRRSRSRRRG